MRRLRNLPTIYVLTLGILIAAALFVAGPSSQAGTAEKMLTIIGEAAHNYEPVEKQEIALIEKASAQTGCLFLEVSPSATQPMQDYIDQKSDYDSSVGAWIAKANQASSEAFSNVIPANLLDAARLAHLKVFGVDGEVFDSPWRHKNEAAVQLMRKAGRDKNAWQKVADIAIIERNQIMTANIANHMMSDVCASSLFIIGAAHTQSDFQGVSVTPIQDLLLAQGISTRVMQTKLCGDTCHSADLFHE